MPRSHFALAADFAAALRPADQAAHPHRAAMADRAVRLAVSCRRSSVALRCGLALAVLLPLSVQVRSARGGAPGPDYLYPDIAPFVREDQPWLVNWDISNGSLRVQTIFSNIGDGLFEIRTDPTSGSRVDVMQRVYIGTDAGPQFEDFFVNTAVNGHQEHGHIHFENFSKYELLEVTETDGILGVGAPVAGGVKTSFALRDTIKLPDPQWADRVSYTSGNTGVYQRISVGYGDRYSHGTEGQSFSIAGLPTDRLYWLRQTADPTNVIRETDETNNSFEILIDLNFPGEAILDLDGNFVRPGDPKPFPKGDLTLDGVVDTDDWIAFRTGMGQDLSGLTPGEAYLLGDMDRNGRHTLDDFILFRQVFLLAGGAPAQLSLFAIPEPSALLLSCAAGVLIVGGTGRRRGR